MNNNINEYISDVFNGKKLISLCEYVWALEDVKHTYGELQKLEKKFENMLDKVKDSEYLLIFYVLTLIKSAEDLGGLDGKVPAEKAKEYISYISEKFGENANTYFALGLWHRDIHKIASKEIDKNKGVDYLKKAVDLTNHNGFSLELAKAFIKIGKKSEAYVILKKLVENSDNDRISTKIKDEARIWYSHVSRDTKIEIRIPNINFLEKALRYGCNIISIGNDACPICLPSVEQIKEAHEKVSASEKEIKLVTPIVFQRHWDKVVNYIDQVIESFPALKIVVNDYGILNHIKNKGYNMKNISLGHVISYIYEECPWFSYLLDAEGDFLRNSEEITVFDTPGNISVIKEFGIGEVETCLMPFSLTSFYGFWKNGFNVNAMVDMIPFTYGRACHGSRYYRKTVGEDCFEVCNKITKLRYSHRWVFQEKHLKRIKDETYNRISPIHSYGNVLYAKTNYEGSSNDICMTDFVTIDIRHYTDDELESLFSHYSALSKNLAV